MSIISGILSIYTEEKPPTQKSQHIDIKVVLMDTRLRRYLLCNLIYGTGLAFAWPLFPFVIVDRLGLKIWQIAAYSIFSAALSMISQRYVGILMDRIGRRPVVVFSRLIMTVGPIMYIVAKNWTHIAVAETLLGLGMGAWMSSGPTYIIDLAPTEMRATYLSINTAIFGIASFFGNLLGGYITDTFLLTTGIFNGINTGLLISAVLRLSTGLLFFSIYETFKPTQRISE
jgi:MFS family permease